MKKQLVIAVMFVLAVGLLMAGCGKDPQEATKEEPAGDENWILGFAIVPDMDDLINATVHFGEELFVEVPLVITKDGEVTGGFENRHYNTNKVTINGAGTYHNQKLFFTGSWEAETHTHLSHTSSIQSGMFTIEGEYVDNLTFVLDENNSSATITSNWRLEYSVGTPTDGTTTGEDIYKKPPSIKVYGFRPKAKSWSPN